MAKSEREKADAWRKKHPNQGPFGRSQKDAARQWDLHHGSYSERETARRQEEGSGGGGGGGYTGPPGCDFMIAMAGAVAGLAWVAARAIGGSR